jgi:hypothetical protein
MRYRFTEPLVVPPPRFLTAMLPLERQNRLPGTFGAATISIDE